MSNEIDIRFARPEDLVDLIVLGKEFYEEGPFKGRAKEDPDWGLFAFQCDHAIHESRMVVACDGPKVVGFVLLSISYWLFPSGDLAEEIFFVTKEYRGTGAARGLRAAIQKYADIIKPALGWGGSTSGFGDKVHQNAMEKDGYIPLGRQCVKIYEGEVNGP